MVQSEESQSTLHQFSYILIWVPSSTLDSMRYLRRRKCLLCWRNRPKYLHPWAKAHDKLQRQAIWFTVVEACTDSARRKSRCQLFNGSQEILHRTSYTASKRSCQNIHMQGNNAAQLKNGVARTSYSQTCSWGWWLGLRLQCDKRFYEKTIMNPYFIFNYWISHSN